MSDIQFGADDERARLSPSIASLYDHEPPVTLRKNAPASLLAELCRTRVARLQNTVVALTQIDCDGMENERMLAMLRPDLEELEILMNALCEHRELGSPEAG